MNAILQLSEIDKRFDGVRALQGASFSLFPGEVRAPMEENGSGKSTLAKIIAGAIAADGGQFSVDGSPVTIGGPRDAQRLGISIIYQELDLFPHLTVAENMAIGNHRFQEQWLVRRADLDRFAEPFLQQVGLTCSPRCEVRTLSVGERQLVAIARALSLRARIILMDEPTSSLFDDADRVTVLRDGKTVGTRAIQEVSSAELIRMMIGKEWPARDRKRAEPKGEVVLSFPNVTTLTSPS